MTILIVVCAVGFVLGAVAIVGSLSSLRDKVGDVVLAIDNLRRAVERLQSLFLGTERLPQTGRTIMSHQAFFGGLRTTVDRGTDDRPEEEKAAEVIFSVPPDPDESDADRAKDSDDD